MRLNIPGEMRRTDRCSSIGLPRACRHPDDWRGELSLLAPSPVARRYAAPTYSDA